MGNFTDQQRFEQEQSQAFFDNLLKVLGLFIVMIIIGACIYFGYIYQERSWAQTQSCNGRGGVMISGSFDGCVKIVSMNTEK